MLKVKLSSLGSASLIGTVHMGCEQKQNIMTIYSFPYLVNAFRLNPQ